MPSFAVQRVSSEFFVSGAGVGVFDAAVALSRMWPCWLVDLPLGALVG